MRSTLRNFSKLEQEWYAKLANTPDSNGDKFVDIEDCSNPERPLKEWHSQKFLSERSRVRQEEREAYDLMMARLINSSDFTEICKSMVSHGNSSITPVKVRKIIELHRDGKTQRQIAKKLRCGKKCVHLTLQKAQSWMKVA